MARMRGRRTMSVVIGLGMVLVPVVILDAASGPANAAPSYNPAAAATYHAPLSSVALLAVTHRQAQLAQNGGGASRGPTVQSGSGTAPDGSAGPLPGGSGAPLPGPAIGAGVTRFTTDTSYVTQSETSVAVDPANPNHVVGGYVDARLLICPLLSALDCPSGWTNSISGFTVSSDKGTTLLQSDDLPGVNAGGTFLTSWGDPDVVPAGPGSPGNFYYSSLLVDPNTGANGVGLAVSNANLWKTAACTTPPGTPAKNPCWKAAFVSGDTSSFPADMADKPLTAVDYSSAKGDRYRGDAYVAWDHFNPDGTSASYLARCTPTVSCTLVAGGANPLSGSDQFTSFTTPAVGPDGSVYVTWCDYGTPSALTPIVCSFRASPPGGVAFGAAKVITSLDDNQAVVGYATEQFRVSSVPMLAVDHSTGVSAGDLYFVIDACDSRSYYPINEPAEPGTCGTSEVLLSMSTDHGSTWSSAAPVATSATNAVTVQPWVTVDPSNGAVHVVYYSSQLDPAYNHRLDVWDTSSSNAGGSWTTQQVTTTPIEPDADPNYFDNLSSFGGAFIVPQFGDYMQATALGGTLYTLFSATYTPEVGIAKTSPYLSVGTR